MISRCPRLISSKAVSLLPPLSLESEHQVHKHQLKLRGHLSEQLNGHLNNWIVPLVNGKLNVIQKRHFFAAVINSSGISSPSGYYKGWSIFRTYTAHH